MDHQWHLALFDYGLLLAFLVLMAVITV